MASSTLERHRAVGRGFGGRVCILDDFMKGEVGAYVPEASVPGGSVAEELAETSEYQRSRHRVIEFRFRHCSGMLVEDLDT